MAPSTLIRESNLLAALALGLTDRIREAEEAAAGLGSAAPSAIVALSQFLDGGSLDDLRQVVGLTPSGTVRMVDKLEAARLVERRPGRDLRGKSVVLTRHGRQMAKRILDARRTASASILEGLTEDESAAVAGLLEALLRRLTSARLEERSRGQSPPGGWLCRLCDFEACGRPEGRCPVATHVRADD